MGDTPSVRLPTTENSAKKWLRPIGGTMAIASRVFASPTSEPARPIKNCSAHASQNGVGHTCAASNTQPTTIPNHASSDAVMIGLLPTRSSRVPSSARLASPPRNAADMASNTRPSDMPATDLRNTTTNVPSPPFATDHATFIRSNFRNGGYPPIARHGTGSVEVCPCCSGISGSGMRLRK